MHDVTQIIDLRQPEPLTVVYGGGGAVGISRHVTVIDAMEKLGLPVRTAPSIGTSAGSWACGAARLGLGFDEFAALGDFDVPNRRRGALEAMAREVFGDARPTRIWISAVAVRSLRRHLLDGRRHDLADLVAASSAVPGVFAPHRVGSRDYIDGGVRSMASADQAPPAALMVASLPIGGPLFGPVGRTFERVTRNAMARWRSRHGGATVVVRPDARFAAAVGRHPRGLMDTALAREVYPLAYDAAARHLERRLTDLQMRGVALTRS